MISMFMAHIELNQWNLILQLFCDVYSFIMRIFSWIEIANPDRSGNFIVIYVCLNFKGLLFIGLIIKK